MYRIVLCLAITTVLMACSTLSRQETLSGVKAELECIEYKDGAAWEQISDKLGVPDVAPLPEPGTGLGKNSRIYKNTVTIFYTDLREIKEGEKVRFHEVVTNIEVCKEK